MIALVLAVTACSRPAAIHIVGALVDIHENRFGPAISNRFGRGHERVRHRDHFISWPNAQRQKGKPKRLRAAPHADCVLSIAVRPRNPLKSSDKRPTGKGGAVDDLPDGAVESPRASARDGI